MNETTDKEMHSDVELKFITEATEHTLNQLEAKLSLGLASVTRKCVFGLFGLKRKIFVLFRLFLKSEKRFLLGQFFFSAPQPQIKVRGRKKPKKSF